jgi:predicted signal transduction protein with EAL and GGDEF domain
LKRCVRAEDTVARFAGDEFTLLLPGITHAEHVVGIVRKILDAFKQPWMIGMHELYVTTSIGIALYPGDGEDTETLLKNADTAMYHAKEQGRDTYQFYTPAMHIKSFETMMLENNLRRALDREEFVVYYQPLVNINTGEVVGMEALVRWRHPERGLISPEEFLSLSENTGLIAFIDELVLYTVCVQCKAWQDAGFQPMIVAVNLSAHTFQQPNLLETVTSVLEKTGLDPHFLGLEITESIAMQDIETTLHKLSKLSDLGVQIAIDDFGTGFSSLYYLKKFPINKLKISKHFVSDIVNDHNDKLIVESVIALAKSLKFKVVAEGVETEEQLIFLKQRQCDEMQGYLFCKPLPAEAFGKWEKCGAE